MILNDAGLAYLNQRYNILFEARLGTAPVQWQSFAMEQDAGKAKTVHYPISGSMPKMREWIGERAFGNFENYDWALTNKKYESTVEVDADDIEDDQYGLYDSKFTDMGGEAAALPDDLMVDLLAMGHQALCYDGQYYFDNDHPVDPKDSSKGVQSNRRTGSALTQANYSLARAQMLTLRQENGSILRVNPTTLIVPAALENTGKEILQAENISRTGGSTQTNTTRGTANLLVLPQLDAYSTTTWYLSDSSRAVKGLIWQKRVAPAMQNPSMTAFHQFMKDKIIWGARARGVAGYYLWQLLQRNEA